MSTTSSSQIIGTCRSPQWKRSIISILLTRRPNTSSCHSHFIAVHNKIVILTLKTQAIKNLIEIKVYHVHKRYLKLNSYGITCRNCEKGSFFPLSRHLIASFASSFGNWRQIQSSNDSKSFAKSSKYQSNNFGIANFVVETPIAACKYSFLATSNSFSTWDAVYTLTFIWKSS